MEPTWDTFHLPFRSVRVRHRDSNPIDPFWFKPLGAGNSAVLATVSRRHSIRDRIDVWSEFNEAWEVSRVDLVEVALRALASDRGDLGGEIRDALRARGATADDISRVEVLVQALLSTPQSLNAK
jgi:hypothetical protein